ncbi:MAG TPA: molybdopterin converting factor subunit 1 [Candidatus Nitrosopolaris sp.]|nr:molybdopterin converting factor subunit 1 [Candidatus Nitrosopolaris sp.]
MKRTPRFENKAILSVKVKVLYFAQIREAAGISEEEVLLVKGSTVSDLISKIKENHPKMLRQRENFQLAVNCNRAGRNLSLKEGDQIAVFPPVAGG